MQEFLLDISNYNLRMSNRAYVETKKPLFQIAPRRFKSAKFGVSKLVYSLTFSAHSFPLSVIPKISKNFITQVSFLLKLAHMAFVEFRSLNSKADHLVNWDLVSLIHGGMDANQVLFLNHLVSDLRFQLKNKNNKL